MPGKTVDPLVWALRKERLRRGYSYRQMAEKSGISVSTLKRIESGRVDLKLSQYRAMTAAMGASDWDMTVLAAGYQPGVEVDVSAVLRMIPQPQRRIMTDMLLEMATSYAKK